MQFYQRAEIERETQRLNASREMRLAHALIPSRWAHAFAKPTTNQRGTQVRVIEANGVYPQSRDDDECLIELVIVNEA